MKGITKVVRWFWLMSGYVVLIKNKKGHDLGRTEYIKVDRFRFAFKPFLKFVVNPSQLLNCHYLGKEWSLLTCVLAVPVRRKVRFQILE